MKERIQKLQSQLQKGEAALITSVSNRFHLTSFRSSAGALVVTSDEAVFFVDFRYYEKAKQIINGAKVLLCTDQKKQIAELLKDSFVKTLYIETDKISVDSFAAYKNAFDGVEVSNNGKISKLIADLRAVKSESELANIKAAQGITDKAFSYILGRIEKGRTEKEIALDLEFYARKNGSEGVAFNFIVVSGENSSLPHGVPTDKPLKDGDFLTMDFGARVNGYCSDMTRTVAIGNVSDEQKKVYNTVLKAQELAFEKIKAGAICKDVDAAARDYINESGYEGCFGHGLGHSIGIDVHESPAFNTRDTTVLKSGMVITVEPGIYLENRFGVRIEDMICVTDTGYENLTNSNKQLIII